MALLYKAANSADTSFSNSSCTLHNNSAALGSTDLASNYGIVCHAPAHKVTWYRPDGSKVSPSHHTATVFSSSSDGSRLMRSSGFREEWNGVYKCQVAAPAGDDGRSAQSLYIGIYATREELMQVDLDIQVNNSTDKLVLNCSSVGLPATKVTWFFEDRNITSLGEERQLITNATRTAYNSLFFIRGDDIILEDGTYKCQVESNLTHRNATREFAIGKGQRVKESFECESKD